MFLIYWSYYIVLYAKKEKIYPTYVPKYKSNRQKQVIFLTISNRDKCHYRSLKKLSALWRGINSKHHGHFYCLNCLNSFATEKKLNHMKNYVEIKIFVML